MTDDLARAKYHLIGWGIWRRTSGNATSRGYNSQSLVLSTGGNSQSFDHMVEAEDSRIASVCDTIIYDLPSLYRIVLESEYILQGTVKSNRKSTSELLMDAQIAFWSKAKKRLV